MKIYLYREATGQHETCDADYNTNHGVIGYFTDGYWQDGTELTSDELDQCREVYMQEHFERQQDRR